MRQPEASCLSTRKGGSLLGFREDWTRRGPWGLGSPADFVFSQGQAGGSQNSTCSSRGAGGGSLAPICFQRAREPAAHRAGSTPHRRLTPPDTVGAAWCECLPSARQGQHRAGSGELARGVRPARFREASAVPEEAWGRGGVWALHPGSWTLQLGTKGGVPREPSPGCWVDSPAPIVSPEMGNSAVSVEGSRLTEVSHWLQVEPPGEVTHAGW